MNALAQCWGSALKFTLTYDGELRSNGGPKEKWDIRKKLHPQLEELWQIDPVLKQVWAERSWPVDAGYYVEPHHSISDEYAESPPVPGANYIDLCAPVEKGKRKFLPLVRETYLLTCALKIIFLRKEPPGRVYQGGDLDNRLKTLLDALSVPAHDEQVVTSDTDAPPVIYTLMQDDSAITRIDVDTHRLLSRPDGNKHDVRLVIEVDVRVAQTRNYNRPFLGG